MNFYNGETNIVCSNIENSLKFYKDILGFEFIEEEDGAVRLKNGDQYFLLLPHALPFKDISKYCTFPEYSIDLLADDIKKAAEYFESHNVNFEKRLKVGETWFVIRDPDGLVLEIIQK